MGVPKFFRYTSERYPCLNELVKQYQIPDFDNMYLDMNGIIHNCSHPDDSNPHFRITEEKIFEDIFHYLSILFQIIKPKKLFFMAIDGVAPRAKMNQQRGRRFRSAKEAEKLEEDAKAKGEVLPTEKRFDSNCITPGTVFMARLHEQLRFFVKQKMSTDPMWSKVKVILSGHETPGEGEHKIMDYIRWSRSQPEYDPNTRHCLYGLDADLIMLGMCTHEPHFALLREEVKFGKTTQRATTPEETNFYLLHLSLLREYLEQEFIAIKDNLPFKYDIEKIVDDWVLMGFLVGNDFIPNLPNMHISNDALPLLYSTYMKVLPTLDGYINEAGDLNLERFEIFMKELSKIDMEKFQDTYADLKYFEAKTGRRPNANERKEYKPNNDDTFNVNVDDIKANKPDDELQALINATEDMFMDDMNSDGEEYEETSDEEATMAMEFILHKKDYYMNKLDYSKVTDEVLAGQAEGYVRAIQWNLFYYYKGCPSWCWYYPHHYAPFISDIKGFKDLNIEFELGEPFKPFEQLLAVLPSASKSLLPTPFHDLMIDQDSPIVHYYPINFETDLNGKKNDWEAVVLIPFIDETNLLSAMSPCYQRLTEEEFKRNSHGPMCVYNWSKNSLGVVPAPEFFSPIENCHAIETFVFRKELEVSEKELKRGMLPNANRDMLYPGFPTMRHLKYQTSLKKSKVKVFDQPSRNENMIVEIIKDEENVPALEMIAEDLLGKTIWVGWPHLTQAKVISVSNEKMRLHHVEKRNNEDSNYNGGKWTKETNAGNLHKQWISERFTVIEHNMNRLGIELGDVQVIVHAVNLKGFKYIVQDNVRMALEPEWCSVPCGYAYQAIVTDVKAYILPEVGKMSTPQEAYPPGDKVVLMTQGQYYGCIATVMDSEAIRSGRIKVQVLEKKEPTPVIQQSVVPYRTANHAAASCGISSQLLSRITGTIFIILGEKNDLPTETQPKVNIGLNLKSNKRNLEVSGFTRRCATSGAWTYSPRCVALLKDYAQNYPELFNKLAHCMNNAGVFFESEVFPGQVGEKKPQEIVAWLKSQPHTDAARRECSSEALEPEEMKALANVLDKQIVELSGTEKKVSLHVKWSLLYKPELHQGNIQPDPKADYRMYDRVICVAKNITVPFGLTGTVTAVHGSGTTNTVRLSDRLNAEPSYQVMFDKPFPAATTQPLFDEDRFYRMQPTHMLNISFGRKLRDNIVTSDSALEPFSFSQTPTLLRREDGHNSAFANYSPPRDIKTPVAEPPTNISTNGETQDPTHLLKNLLKISENNSNTKTKTPPEQNHNWRAKTDEYNRVPPPQKYTQQINWRKECGATSNKPQVPSNEWTNSNSKKLPQPPLLPFPTFAPPLAGAGPSQVLFPPYMNPAFLQHNPGNAGTHGNNGNHGNTGNHGNAQRNHQKQHGFPSQLPNIAMANMMMPNWTAQNQLNPPLLPTPQNVPHVNQTQSNQHNNGQNINPFVPLQVQTSRRRVQNTGLTIKKENVSQPATNQQIPQSQLPSQSVPQQQGQSRPQKKRKPRIAANLPFQTE